MERKDREETKTDRREERDPRERTAAPPPIEREHETAEGALEEDEKRKHERR